MQYEWKQSVVIMVQELKKTNAKELEQETHRVLHILEPDMVGGEGTELLYLIDVLQSCAVVT